MDKPNFSGFAPRKVGCVNLYLPSASCDSNKNKANVAAAPPGIAVQRSADGSGNADQRVESGQPGFDGLGNQVRQPRSGPGMHPVTVDFDPQEFVDAPVRYFNMLHDDFKTPPAETRHL